MHKLIFLPRYQLLRYNVFPNALVGEHAHNNWILILYFYFFYWLQDKLISRELTSKVLTKYGKKINQVKNHIHVHDHLVFLSFGRKPIKVEQCYPQLAT